MEKELSHVRGFTRRVRAVLASGMFAIASPLVAAAQAPGGAAATGDAGRWPYTLPFLADASVKQGDELPLPLEYPTSASGSTAHRFRARVISWISDQRVA